MTGDARDSEAVWRELVAHYSAADGPDDSPAPWPDRENLPAPAAPAKDAPDSTKAPGPANLAGGIDAEPDRQRAGDDTQPGSVAGDDTETGSVAGGPPSAADPVPGVIPGPPQVRIIRPAAPQPPPPAEEDEHFVPPPPPPLPKLDPVSKGAWAALFGGPAYLLVAVLVGWQIPSIAAFIAVAAFVGGFATLVVRMDDRPPDDSGPDNGAVV
jgi:hypothetical protein